MEATSSTACDQGLIKRVHVCWGPALSFFYCTDLCYFEYMRNSLDGFCQHFLQQILTPTSGFWCALSYRKTTFISDWLKWESGTSVLKVEKTTYTFSTNKNSVVAIFFNLKPYVGSRTLNNQFTSSQKSVRFCRKNHQANKSEKQQKGQQKRSEE